MIGALVVLILTVMVSGSLAVYQASIDDIDGSFDAARFVLTSTQAEQLFSKQLKISPGDTLNTDFTVCNYSDAGVTETDMRLVIKAEFSGGLDPVEMRLCCGETVLGSCTGDGNFTWDSGSAVFTANLAAEKNFTLYFVWPVGEAGSDNPYIGLPATFKLTITGLQTMGTVSTVTSDTTVSATPAQAAEDSAKRIKAAVEAACAVEENHTLLLTGSYSDVDSNATALAGGRRDLIVAQLTDSVSTAWKVLRRVENGKSVFDIYVADTVADSGLRSMWWTAVTKISSDGTVTHGYMRAKFNYDADNTPYRILDKSNFTTDLNDVPNGRLYE